MFENSDLLPRLSGLSGGAMDGLILAGGKSSRMGGRHKGNLQYGGKSFIERLISELRPMVERLWLSYGATVQGECPDCGIVRDEYTDCGPMGGLHAGLKHCQSEVLLVAACDMPLLKREFYDYLLGFLEGHDGVVAVMDGRIQPMAAVYTKKLLLVFERCLEARNYRLRDALAQAEIRYVDVTEQPQLCAMLQNINTGEEYASLIQRNQ